MNIDLKKVLLSISKSLVIFYLFIFPLGQLLKFKIELGSRIIPVNLSDVIVLASPIFLFLLVTQISTFYKPFVAFVVLLLFGFVLSVFTFGTLQVVPGFFYLVRLIAYIAFSLFVYELVRQKVFTKATLLSHLLIASVFTALLGWLQYLIIPDLRFLKSFGWDDHLYRLTGTFLDPTFTGIILLFGFIISGVKYIDERKFTNLLLPFGFLITILFTYSRASLLAFAVSVIYLFLKYKNMKLKTVVLVFVILVLGLLMLPRKSSEGTLLERTQSVYAKYTNYDETFTLIKQSPLFGVGFNNLCHARTNTLGGYAGSHACSGADSSVMFILATTGVVGLLIFLDLVIRLNKNISEDRYGLIIRTAGVALLVHSIFAESMFYSFVLGFLGILYAISIPVMERNER